MNRLPRSSASAPPASRCDQARTWAAGPRGGSVLHSLFRPMHYESNYAYPLLVWMHGPRDTERQLDTLMPLLSLRNYAAIGPRATRADRVGFCWGELPSEAEATEAELRALECVEVASRKLNIASQRVFIGGYEDGGSMALRVALRNPDRFAGAISLCGAFPRGQAPLANLKLARQLPLLVTNGRDATRYTVDQTCEELRLFHAAGMAVTLRQYPCGDELDSNMLRDMNAWMMEQVTGVPADSDTSRQYEPWSEESN